MSDPFGARSTLETPLGSRTIHRLDALASAGDVERLPYCIKVLLESCLRHCDGRIVTEECSTCRGEGHVTNERTLQIKVPPGVDSGSQLRITGEGEAGPLGGPAGDLYVVLRAKEHALFRRDGTHLFCEIPVSVPQATLGATLAFLSSRYLLRDWIQTKFGDKLATINKGVEKDGAFYLFSLRLIPVFPFFLINLLMGLTPMSVSRYYITSQIGMLPGTAVFLNAGTQLAEIDSLSGIVSPSVLLSFALLGIFPIVAKWLMGKFRSAPVAE